MFQQAGFPLIPSVQNKSNGEATLLCGLPVTRTTFWVAFQSPRRANKLGQTMNSQHPRAPNDLTVIPSPKFGG